MTFIQPIAFETGIKKYARLYTVNAFNNPLLCSKYFLAKGLFEHAHLENKPHVKEVVCASIGNFGVSVAYLAARHHLRATIFLPKNVPRRIIQLMEVLGAHVHSTTYTSLSSEVSPCAFEYTQKSESRILLHQLDLDVCSEIYAREIFASLIPLLPVHGIMRPIRMFLPWGTGSLFKAGASFLQSLPGNLPHEIVPVSPWASDKIGDLRRERMSRENPNVRFFPIEEISEEETSDMFRGLAPHVELPFGLISAESLAVAYRHFVAIDSEREIDLVPVLTDGFVASYIADADDSPDAHDK